MDSTYLVLKLIHIIGAIVFLGNLIVTGWWKAKADYTRDAQVISFAQQQVTVTDFLFTGGGAVLVLIGGIGNVMRLGADAWGQSWVTWGLALFTVSALIWLLVLIPIQVRQARIINNADDGMVPEQYWKLGRQWIVWGLIAMALPLANVYWMVFKPL